MNVRSLGVLVVLGLAAAAAKQVTAKAEQPAPAEYDGALAQALGADERGMRNYVLAILKTGPRDASITGGAREDVFRGHFANMERLATDGKLVVAGPFGKNDQAYRGLFILAVDTVDEARKLAETDPAVEAGVFVVDYLPWYGSAALMQMNEIHARITPPGNQL